MWIPYESREALVVNKQVFEALYYYALEKSMQLAKEHGSYQTFGGSPLSKGILQFDMWGVTPSDKFDWARLRVDIAMYGVRNSLLIALMPTASTAQIMGSTESFEPFNSCMYLRRTLSGEFLVINSRLIETLQGLGLWSKEMNQRIMFHRGSIQRIATIPKFVRDMYKTVWEIKKKHYIDMSADRGAFVCQSQSLNIYMEDSTNQGLSDVHMYGWSKGLKTGSYYIRNRPATNAQSFTIEPDMEKKFRDELRRPDEKECLSCGA
jgi:ribonucleotide reductase alpha subunit